MSVPPTQPDLSPPQRGTSGSRVFMSFVGKTLWLGVVVCGFYYLMNHLKQPTGTVIVPHAQAPPPAAGQASPAPSLLPTPSPAPAPSPVNLENVELVTAASVQRQQLTAAKFKQRQLIATFGEVKRALDEWDTELAAWEKSGPPLLKSDDGKKLASDPALVKRFRVVADLDRPSREALTAARKQAEDLISPIREAEQTAEDASTPAEDLAKSLRELQTQARKARDSYRDGRGAVEGLIAQAGAAGEKTLEQVIAAQRREEALARAAFIQAETKKAEDEGTRLVAEENAKLARTQSELEAARIRDLAEQKRQGPIRSGTTWKGTMRLVDSTASSTLTIARRVGDSIEGTVSWTEAGSTATIRFSTGKVTGHTVKFTCEKVVRGAAEAGFTYNAVYDPISGTLSGTAVKDNRLGATYAYRLSTGQDE
jgi:hypothetical protein